MTYEEDYQLSYDIFLAESELYNDLIQIGAGIVTESTPILSLQEDAKETITNYLNKIVQGLQKVWDKFKDFFKPLKEQFDKVADKIKDKLGMNPGFTIKNFPHYKINVIESIKLQEYKPETDNTLLDDREKYINAKYPQINYTGNVKDSLNKACGADNLRDEQATPQLVGECWRFVIDKYTDLVNSTQKDLDTLNTSFKNIGNQVNNVSTNGATPNTGEAQNANESYITTIEKNSIAIYESYLLEAPDPQKPNPQVGNANNKNNEKMSFQDDGNTDNQEGQGKTNQIKLLTNYVKINTDILSAKMNLIRNIYRTYSNIIKHFMTVNKISADKNNDNKNNNQQETQQQSTTNIAQVNTDTK